MERSIKRKLYDILNVEPESGIYGKVFNIGITVLIMLSVIMVIVESVPWIESRYRAFFWYFELVSVIIFTVEYVGRLWTITLNPKYRHFIKGRASYALTFMMVIDFLAIAPFYLPFLITVDLRVLRLLRLLRLVRIFKLGRYTKSMEVFAKVFFEKRTELTIAGVFFLFYLIISSSILYLVENDVQPDEFSSIPAAMWWGSAALTTVGYGDIFPVTPLGKLLGAVLAILGIGMFALPVGVLATGFVEAFDEMKAQKDRDEREARGDPSPEEEEAFDLALKRIELLERLNTLKRDGAITEEEFLREKAILMKASG